MKRPTGSPPPYLASSVTEKTLAANLEERLHSVLATLKGCRAVLLASAERETAQTVSVAILQLRQKLNQISDAELRAFCDAVAPDDRPAGRPPDPKSPQGHRSTILKLVK